MVNRSRKEIEKEARIKAILDAATRLFSEKDFHEVTVDEIAEKVGLAKGTLYLYFKNKEDLFHSIVIEKTNELFSRLQNAVMGEGSFIERFENLIRSYLLFFEDHEQFFKIIHSEKTRFHLSNQGQFKKVIFKSFYEWIHFLQEVIEEGQKQGVIKQVPSLALAKALRGIINSFIFHWVFSENHERLLKELPVIMNIFLEGAKHPHFQFGEEK